MRPTLIRRAGLPFPGLYRKNNVPAWQRLHQNHDGLRQWQKGPRAKWMLYPYYIVFAGTSIGTTWMMIRVTLGYKTFY